MATDKDAMRIIRRIVVGLKKHEQSDVVQLAKFTDCIVNFFAPNETSVRISCKLQDDVMLLYRPSHSLAGLPFLKSQERKFINDSDLGSVILQHSPECPLWRLPDFTDVDPIPEKTLSQGVYVGVAVITESSDGRILMTQRADHMRAFPRSWVPPGGHLEIGENIIEGGLRELEEETGLKFDRNTTNTRVLCLWESVYPVLLRIGSPKNHHIVVYLHIKSDESWEQLLMKMKGYLQGPKSWILMKFKLVPGSHKMM
ncbi:nucleoside diphosphate-linked moiety X motif 17 isoform X2 [Anabrus simplex]|uniref:nucleoside diphosphate-linked moiety X motif 17 isoform X2 n=1 Tax=Anabrus simplex TaxID=316456 RepID=UPI0035A376F6